MRAAPWVLALAGLASACSLIAPSDAELSSGLHKMEGGADAARDGADEDRRGEDAAKDATHEEGGSPDAAGPAEGGDEAGDEGGPGPPCLGEGTACSPGECCAGTTCFRGACLACAGSGDECSTTPCCSGICRYHEHQRTCE
jgi:hypothetical protein